MPGAVGPIFLGPPLPFSTFKSQAGITALTAGPRLLELTALRTDIWVNEAPLYVVAGESIAYSITYEGISTLSSPVVTAYKGKADVTSTIFPSNVPTASGLTVTLSAATGFVGNERYVICVQATVDSNTIIKKIPIYCTPISQDF